MCDPYSDQINSAREKLKEARVRIERILDELDIAGVIVLAEVLPLQHDRKLNTAMSEAQVLTALGINMATPATAFVLEKEPRRLRLKNAADFNNDEAALSRAHAMTSTIATALENGMEKGSQFLKDLCRRMPVDAHVLHNKSVEKP